MKIVFVNVGLPREVEWNGKRITTGIYKEPIGGAVNVQTINLEGDGQADLSVHGGRSKAVYAYPSEHYGFWQSELPDTMLPWGVFGENLNTAGSWKKRSASGMNFASARPRCKLPSRACHITSWEFASNVRTW